MDTLIETTFEENTLYIFQLLLSVLLYKKIYIFRTGQKITDCSTGNIIGSNTGVYVGGLPKDYIIQRQEDDPRARVCTCTFVAFFGRGMSLVI